MKRKTLAIPLRCLDYSNTSQVVSLFTPAEGRVDGIAKGVRRPRNTFQGPFDLAVLREIVYIPRRSSTLSVLTESKVLDGYRGIRESWLRFVGANLVLEILHASSVPGQPSDAMFRLSATSLRALSEEQETDVPLWLLLYQARALRLLGFLGALAECVLCRRPWPGGRTPAMFSAAAGGLVCRRCRETAASPTDDATRLPGAAVAGLQALAAGDLVEASALRDLRLARATQRLLTRTCTFCLERPLETIKYSATWLRRAPAPR